MANDDLFQQPNNAATPLTAEDQRDLKPSHIIFKHHHLPQGQ